MPTHTLLSVWAHPDDEAFGPAGLIRAAHEQGIRTVGVSATHGEGGKTGDPPRATTETLGAVRVAELHKSALIMGVDRIEVWEYPDGGLADVTPTILLKRVLALLEEEKPTIVLTFGPDGMYGHPDHIAIHVATTQAFAQYAVMHSQAESPHLYYVTTEPNRTIAPNDAGNPHAPAPLPATTIIDVGEYAEIKRQALAAHATQHQDWQPLLERPNWLFTAYLHRAYPPLAAGEAPETTIFS